MLVNCRTFFVLLDLPLLLFFFPDFDFFFFAAFFFDVFFFLLDEDTVLREADELPSNWKMFSISSSS